MVLNDCIKWFTSEAFDRALILESTKKERKDTPKRIHKREYKKYMLKSLISVARWYKYMFIK
jgi:hypothetical protein